MSAAHDVQGKAQALPQNGTSDTLLTVRDLKMHFPITKGIIFQCARCAAHADDLPGPLRLAQPAHDRGQHHQRAAGPSTASATSAARKERVQELLRVVGLNPYFVNRYPHEFSGGQRQRIGVARALATEPVVHRRRRAISALDVSIQAQVVNMLDDLKQELGLTYLFIAHDLSMVRYISDRVAVMYLGRIVELSSRDEVYDHPLHPYTQALLSAIPVPDPDKEAKRQRIILEGDVPSPANPPCGRRLRTGHGQLPAQDALGVQRPLCRYAHVRSGSRYGAAG
jgi:oligopeptide/dipeptide ABC transporter ATP-binding protein